MRRKIIWIVGVLVLVAIPATVGLLYMGGDDSSSRRAAALVAAGGTSGGYQLTIDTLTPAGKAIEVMSYSWGVSNTAAAAGTGGTATGKAKVEDLVITKQVDELSSKLMLGAASGKHYATATLKLYKPATPTEYVTYVLDDVLISSVQHSGNASDTPAEQVSITFNKITLTSSAIDPKTGKPTNPATNSWDIGANKGA